jgi:isopenicillin-N N-acyltransferase like protein
MSAPDRYPTIRVSGGARERGMAYGRAAAARIARSLEIYSEIFEHHTGWRWRQVTEQAERFTEPIAAAHPTYIDELEGIAEGAGVGYSDVLAINVRTEVMFSAVARRAALECTSFAALPEATANGHTLLAQNWDWNPRTTETVVVLEVSRDDGPDFVTVVEAGLLAKSGMNEAGLGVVTNALITDADEGTPALPYHVILRAILDAENLPGALHAVTGHPRSSAANYLIGHRDGLAVDVEAAPGDYSRVWLTFPMDGLVHHTNHFVCETQGLKDVTRWYGPDSPFRYERARQLLHAAHGRISPEVAGELFADHASHPLGICKHGNPAQPEIERSVTVVSCIYDLTASELRVADGRPCERPYRTLDYGHWAAARAVSARA